MSDYWQTRKEWTGIDRDEENAQVIRDVRAKLTAKPTLLTRFLRMLGIQ